MTSPDERQPVTEAGRHFLNVALPRYGNLRQSAGKWTRQEFIDAILAIEAEAASPAASGDALREALIRVLWHTDIYWRFANDEKGHHDLTRFAEDIADALAASPPLPEGLDVGLASMYLAAAMQEAGFAYDTATASTILNYLQGDEGVGLARLQQPASREDV